MRRAEEKKEIEKQEESKERSELHTKEKKIKRQKKGDKTIQIRNRNRIVSCSTPKLIQEHKSKTFVWLVCTLSD